MQVLIIRHAIAAPHGTPGFPDEERPLTPEGEEKFRAAARGLARILDRPDAILTSPLPRARRTAEIAARAWGKIEPENLPALAGGSFDEIDRALALRGAEETVALVGHEPHLSGLLARILRAGEAERLPMRKGGAALVDLPGRPAGGGTLVWFMPPRLLRKLGED